MDAPSLVTGLDLRGRTITTYILFEVHQALAGLATGDRLDVTTDAFTAIDNDIAAWCRATGHRLVGIANERDLHRFSIEKGVPVASSHRFAAVISDDGLFELLSPLGFALAAALEGHRVALYFQGPAVRVLARGHTARMHGPWRVFSRFPRTGLERAGHLPPQDKLRQLRQLGAGIYACGPSMQHFKVSPDDLVFDDVVIAEYPTFMEQMVEADIHFVN